MTAVVLEGPGDPARVRARRASVPVREHGDVLVRVHTAAVNPSDVLNARGLPITTYPRVPGRDFAGTIVDGPPEMIGRAVWGTGSGDLGFSRDGSHAEYVAVPASAAVALPSTFTLSDAGASGLAYATAAAGLKRADLRPGIRVLVSGAAGAVGCAASAIALQAGAAVIGAVKDDVERERAEALLPAARIVTTGDAFVEEVLSATDGRGVDVLYDTVGNVLFEPQLAVLADDGVMVVITARPGEPVSLDLSQFYRRRLSLLGVSSTRADASWCAELLVELMPGFESRALPPVPIAASLGVERAADAYQLVASGSAPGRIVLTFEADDPPDA